MARKQPEAQTERRRSKRNKKRSYKIDALTKRNEKEKEEDHIQDGSEDTSDNNLSLREEIERAEKGEHLKNLLNDTPYAIPGGLCSTPCISSRAQLNTTASEASGND